MKKWKIDIGSWITLLLAVGILLISFPDLLLHGNTAMFTIGGDGIKNYFTVLYYLQNNSGVHFNGMNYPFGEHISFADAQTGLVVPFQWLIQIFPGLKAYGIALINYAVLGGIVAGALSVYYLLKYLKVNTTFAVFGALLICFLSPQMFRIESHYGLSYIFFFPLGLLLYLKAVDKKTIGSLILAVLLIAWMGLLHFYLAVIVCLFLIAYAFVSLFANWKKADRKTQVYQWLIPVGSMIVLQVFIRLTDHVKDRPSRPWGFFTALADWRTVFLPHSTDLLGKPVSGYPVVAEGFAYIGVAAILFLIFLIIRTVVRFIIQKNEFVFSPFTKQEMLLLLSSILLLLFAMGIPFIWHLEFLVDWLSFLRQFRGLGRFAWPFYYISTLFTIVLAYRLYISIEKKWVRVSVTTVLILIGSTWGAEDFYRMKSLQRLDDAAQVNYYRFHGRNYEQLLSKAGRYPSDFQAILCLPFYHIGSEKYSIDHWPSPFYSMKASYQTHIPMLNVMMSRTSLSQSSATVQLLSDSLIRKDILSSFNPVKPILLLTSGDQFSAAELRLIQQSQLLITDGEIAMYQLPLTAFQQEDAAVIQQYQQKDSLLYQHIGYWSNQVQTTAVLKFAVPSATIDQPILINQSNLTKPVLLDSVFTNTHNTDTLQVSLWIKIEAEKDALPLLEIEQLADKKQLSYTEFPFKWSTNVVGDYLCVSGELVLQEKTNRLKISLSQGSQYFNLLIKQKGEIIFQPAGTNGFYYNNMPARLH